MLETDMRGFLAGRRGRMPDLVEDTEMIFGQLLVYAVIAAFLAWLAEWLLSRWGAKPWFVRIAYGFVLLYAFAVLTTSGPIRIGQ